MGDGLARAAGRALPARRRDRRLAGRGRRGREAPSRDQRRVLRRPRAPLRGRHVRRRRVDVHARPLRDRSPTSAAALRELRRVLAAGGTLVVSLDNLANPLVAVRNALPFRWLHGIGLVPHYVGATCRPRELQRLLAGAGFDVNATTAIMHVPRVIALAVGARHGHDARARAPGTAADAVPHRAVRGSARGEALMEWIRRVWFGGLAWARALPPARARGAEPRAAARPPRDAARARVRLSRRDGRRGRACPTRTRRPLLRRAGRRRDRLVALDRRGTCVRRVPRHVARPRAGRGVSVGDVHGACPAGPRRVRRGRHAARARARGRRLSPYPRRRADGEPRRQAGIREGGLPSASAASGTSGSGRGGGASER